MGPKVAGGPDPRSAAGNVLSIDGRHCACARALPGDRVSTTHATGCCGRSRPIGRRTGPITSFACSLSKPHADFHSVPEITDADVECLGALRTSATNRPSRRHPQAHRPQAPPLLVGRVAPSRQLTDMAARRRVPLRMRWSPAPPRRHLRSRTDPKDPPAPRSASRSAPGRSGQERVVGPQPVAVDGHRLLGLRLRRHEHALLRQHLRDLHRLGRRPLGRS